MKVRDLMMKDPKYCLPSDTAQHAAWLMRDEDLASLPVIPIGKRAISKV